VRRATLVAVTLLLAGTGAVAHARPVTVPDPNDARGALDIRRVRKLGDERPLWRINTYRRWRATRIYDRGYLLVYLDTFGGEHFDYRALVYVDRARVKARLFRDRARKRDFRVSYLDAWRRGLRSASVRIPLRKTIIPEARESYRWYVQTLFSGTRCRRVCYDLAPGREGVEEPLDPSS
jgi:hypothetical protein